MAKRHSNSIEAEGCFFFLFSGTPELLGWHLSRSGKSKTAEAALEQALITHFRCLERVTTPFLLRSDNSLVFTSLTRLYRRFRRVWRKEALARLQAGRHPLDFSQCVTIADHGAHEALVHRLQQSGEPAIIVAGGGMCQGGRIVNYLQALLPDARTDLLLAGFQAQGTPGRLLQSGCSSLWLDGVEVGVASQIHCLSGYSAHADQQELLTFVQGMRSPPRAIRLVHGEPAAQQALALKLAGLCPEALLSCACKL